MKLQNPSPLDQPKRLQPGLVAAGALAWGEVFILIPMHAFWMLFRSTPLVAENTASATVAAVGLLLLLMTGLASLVPRVRASLAGAEWLFHLTSAIGMLVLLFYVTLRDPLSPGLPITWPLCFWSVTIAFTVLSDVLLQERIRAQAVASGRVSWGYGALVAVVVWAGWMWLASGMAWAPYYWTAALVFHALMAPWSRRSPLPPHAPVQGARSVAALAESLFAASLMLAALLRGVFTYSMLGRAEMKWFEFVNLGAHPAFLAGIATALVAARLRVTPFAHAAMAACFFFSGETTTWPISLVLGYGLAVLFVSACGTGALGSALAIPAVMATWAFGMLGFMLAGLVVVSGIGADFVRELAGSMRAVVPVLYALWLGLAGVALWRSKRHSAGPVPSAMIPRYGSATTYLAVWTAILIPVGLLAATTMWPPVRFERPQRIEVGETAGVCHAGYSRSDQEYADLARLGVHLMRVDFHWSRVQPAPDTWDFSDFDTYLDAAEKHNIQVLALLVFDNNAVEKSQQGAKRRQYIAREDVPLFLQYIRRTVGRYKNRVYAWELWNEPDMPRFWDGPMDELYQLIRQSAETVREVHPQAILVGPAMTSPLGAHSARAIEDLHAIGALRAVDHPSMHAYISDPRGYYGEFFRIRNAAAKFGHPGTVWITELGNPDGGVYPWSGSREHIAAHVIKAYTIATCAGIEKLVWYCYRDSSAESQREKPNDSEGFFGLTSSDGAWKPAAHAYSLFSTHSSNSVIRADLVHVTGGLAARQVRAALYRRTNGESALVMWYEPGLRPGSHARISLDLGTLSEPALAHDITSGKTKPVLDRVLDVTETPTLITYKAADPEAGIRLHATTSPADAAWLALAALLVLGSAVVAFRPAP